MRGHARCRKKQSQSALSQDSVLLTGAPILRTAIWRCRIRAHDICTKKQNKPPIVPRQARQCHVSGVSGLLRGTVHSYPSLRRANTHSVTTAVPTKSDTVILRLLTDPNAIFFVDKADGSPHGVPSVGMPDPSQERLSDAGVAASQEIWYHFVRMVRFTCACAEPQRRSQENFCVGERLFCAGTHDASDGAGGPVYSQAPTVASPLIEGTDGSYEG